MTFLRWIYRNLYVFIRGHLPRGDLVRFKPYNRIMSARLRQEGDPQIDAVGFVIGGWEIDRFPDYGLTRGSLVMFDGKPCRVQNWELEVVDETG